MATSLEEGTVQIPAAARAIVGGRRARRRRRRDRAVGRPCPARPAAATAMVAAWSERVRFAARRGGYHGGASPQEVLVPVAVLVVGQPPAGWTEAPPAEPAWWRGPAMRLSSPRSASRVPPPPPRRRNAEAASGRSLRWRTDAAAMRRSEARRGPGRRRELSRPGSKRCLRSESLRRPATAWLDALRRRTTRCARF